MIAYFKNLLSKIKKEKQIEIKDEIINIIDEAEQEGEIDEDKSSLIKSALKFSELKVTDIITPRVDVVSIEMSSSKEEIAKVFYETKFSRILVYKESIDNIMGLIYYKDFYSEMYVKDDINLDDIMKPVLFAIATKSIDDLLKELREQRLHVAVIIDEFGGMLGIVTLEDILEELVGEIWDEHEDVVSDIVDKGSDSYEVLGSTNINKFAEKFDVEIITDATTVSGWAMSKIEHIPKENDTFDSDGLRVEILNMQDRRILTVKVRKLSINNAEVNNG